jgi:hypothetical protein
MEIYDSSKSLIENLNYLSGPILAIVGFAAIIQIRLAKKAIVISSQRQAAELATRQIDFYSKEIIPLQEEFNKIEKEKQIDRITIDFTEFTEEYIEKTIGKEKKEAIYDQRYKVMIPILRVLNSLEAFSTYFTKRVADEEIAYSAVGRTFCATIEEHHFDISLILGSEHEDKAYQNLISLYRLWSARIKKEQLSLQKEKILTELEAIKDTKINPIGTK